MYVRLQCSVVGCPMRVEGCDNVGLDIYSMESEIATYMSFGLGNRVITKY